MKTNELKVGDRIKYYYPDWIVADTTIGNGKITRIDDLYIKINQTLIVNKDLIISKLEPLPAQYKEIPLNKEIFNLKVGDLIYYEHESGPIGIYNPTIYKKIQSGHINTIELPYIWTSWQPKESIHPKEKFGQKYGNKIHFSKIVSKGEEISNQYKEIKIENPIYCLQCNCGIAIPNESRCPKCKENPKQSFYCPKCKSGYSINGNFSHIVEQECNNCKNKEKPTPKSFKFDFKVQSTECNYNNSRKRMQCKMTGFGEMKNGRIEEELVLPYDYSLGDINLGKTYTIEIKEKE